jgi:Transposase IS66 family
LLGKRDLAGFAGILQVDGYAAYNRLTRQSPSEANTTPSRCRA